MVYYTITKGLNLREHWNMGLYSQYNQERTEDIVRDSAKLILGFDKEEKDIKQGTGQDTTFNMLGICGEGCNHKPDGWYLPKNKYEVAIIFEAKSEEQDIDNQRWVNELLKNIEITNRKYNRVVGILYNGKSQRVFLNDTEITTNIPMNLQNKQYYIDLFNNQPIDTKQIYLSTMKINNLLHFRFGVNNYYDRMIFTACALVAKRYEAHLDRGRSFEALRNSINETLKNSLGEAIKKNQKLNILLEMFNNIRVSITTNQQAIDDFIGNVEEISKLINSNNWRGEDIMGIFFSEFNRYKGKSENGQVFTPYHITSLMYRLIEVNKDDYVLDAACGSGAFLTKAMSNMITEAGGYNTDKAKEIMSNQLYGIEIDERVFSLACANMLIHKDGKTNLEQLDSISIEAGQWINSKNITKILMNPPYEKMYHPELILKNVFSNCKRGTKAAILLPDNKLEKISKRVVRDILSKNRIVKIIKLPEKTFDEGVSVSIFIFEIGIPQGNNEIFTCYIKDDGLERVKNQGRQDIKERWQEIEDKWVEIINKQSGDDSIKWIKPSEHLSYQKDEEPFSICEGDFIQNMMSYLMFEDGINEKEFSDKLMSKILYSSDISQKEETDIVSINLKGEKMYAN